VPENSNELDCGAGKACSLAVPIDFQKKRQRLPTLGRIVFCAAPTAQARGVSPYKRISNDAGSKEIHKLPAASAEQIVCGRTRQK